MFYYFNNKRYFIIIIENILFQLKKGKNKKFKKLKLRNIFYYN